MVNDTPIRLSKDFRDFLFKASANRVANGTEKKQISLTKICDLIARYFKENNEEYLDLINMEVKK